MQNAIVLAYPKDAVAPFIVCKGRQHIAEKIIQIAKKEQIPIVKDEDASRILSYCDIGTCVPEESWNALARIFAFIKKVECDKDTE